MHLLKLTIMRKLISTPYTVFLNLKKNNLLKLLKLKKEALIKFYFVKSLKSIL